MKTLRVSGVYNSDIVQLILQHQLWEVGFDLRPRSFNFIQLDSLTSLLHQIPASNMKVFLRFENDKDFVIKQVVERVCASSGLIPGKDLWVEYWGDESVEFCESVGLDYVKLLKDQDFTRWFQAERLQGLVLGETFIAMRNNSGNFLSYLGELFNQLPEGKRVDLALDWSAEISKSLLEFYPFQSLCFHIDSKVEVSYRNVNLQLVGQHIEHTKRLLDQF